MVPKHRRNFLPTLIVNLLLWILLALVVFKLPPDQVQILTIYGSRLTIHGNIILFFLVLTLSLTLTLALLLGNTRRGFFLTFFLDSLLFLKMFKFLNWINFLLLSAILLTLEFYFSRHLRLTNFSRNVKV